MAHIILKLPAVKQRTAKSRSAIYKAVADGSFPRPIKLGPKSIGWIESEIEGWILQRIAASRGLASRS